MLDLSIGPELDIAVAVVVMGWHKGQDRPAITGTGVPYESPSYWYSAEGVQQAPCVTDAFANMHAWSPSTDIRAAWQVVEKIEQLDWWIEIWYGNGLYGPKKRAGCVIGAYGDDDTKFEEMADTVPHAVCIATLQAKDYKP